MGGWGIRMTHISGSVTTHSIAFNVIDLIFLDLQNFRKVSKKTGFFTKIILCSITFQSQCMII